MSAVFNSAILNPEEIARFWKKVRKTETCWLWTACPDHLGYGRFRSKSLGSSGFLAHRYSWILHHGSLLRDLDVLHRCDIRLCCAPQHLFLGTHADNMRDMYLKGRAVNLRGSAHGNAKLNEDSIREIRKLREAGETGVALSRRFGVAPPIITLICKRKSWKHVI